MQKLNPIELAWAAGFFDGEGTTSWDTYNNKRVKRTYHYMSLSIGQKRREVLDRFTAAVGGGTIYGPYKRTISGRPTTIYNLRAHGEKGAAIYNRIRPYLSPEKKEQGDAVLEKFTMQQLKPRSKYDPRAEDMFIRYRDCPESRLLLGATL